MSIVCQLSIETPHRWSVRLPQLEPYVPRSNSSCSVFSSVPFRFVMRRRRTGSGREGGGGCEGRVVPERPDRGRELGESAGGRPPSKATGRPERRDYSAPVGRRSRPGWLQLGGQSRGSGSSPQLADGDWEVAAALEGGLELSQFSGGWRRPQTRPGLTGVE